MNKKTAIYYRVSTDQQTMESQRHEIEKYLKECPAEGAVVEYKDTGISGSSSARPAFQALLRDCRDGLIDTVIVYKLDRLSRAAATAIQTILNFDAQDVKFISVTQPMFSHGTPFRHAMIAIFAELAQMEREAIVERVKAGMAAAKARGVHCGRPTDTTPQEMAQIAELHSLGLSYRETAATVGCSLGKVQRVLKKIKKQVIDPNLIN